MSEDIYYLKTEHLSVGYNGKPLIEDINIEVKKGQIMTLIGPNGSGKSTILKSLTKHISKLGGVVYIDKNDVSKLSNKTLAQNLSVVLSGRIHPEMMTCFDVVAAGRYPYTGNFGTLSDEDKAIVIDSLEKVRAIELIDRDVNKISDGQKQRIMLARALCQQPQIIVLDEPTSFLDIRHKIEILDILRTMSREKDITVIMSLHEIDLAQKISDIIVCVKGDRISNYGKPESVFKTNIINDLYDIELGSYNMLFGSVELSKPVGTPNLFVIGGGASAANIYRELQKRNIAFKTGILFENDVDYYVADVLANSVISQKPFEKITDEIYNHALAEAMTCDHIVVTIEEFGEYNKECEKLILQLKQNRKRVYTAEEYLNLFFD